MRAAWVGGLLMGVFIGFAAHLREKSDPELHKYAELQRKGPYLRRYRPIVVGLILSALVVAEILAVAATHATPDRPVLWNGTMQIAEWGASVFPLAGKYATQITPPLDPQTLYKTQAVTTLFLLAGALNLITLAPYIICMPNEETVVMHKMSDRLSRSRFLSSSPASMLLIMVPFGIIGGFTFFLGWLEFDSVPDHPRLGVCLIAATCYARDDLMLIANGFLRIFASYGFWLAAIMFLIRALTEETE